MKETAIEVRDLRKYYGAVPAVNGISFSVPKGQMVALLGPNGAGKSTVVSILSTVMAFDEGNVLVLGTDIRKYSRRIRKNIGVVFQNGVLDDGLTIMENLRVRGNFYGLKGNALKASIDETAGMTGTEKLMGRYYGTLSGGQKRRCDIARALIHSPSILFLDEPTAGLDPDMRNMVWETIDIIRRRTGMTVIMTTHYMDEASIADNILIMKKGNLVFEGTPMFMRESFSKDRLCLYSGESSRSIMLENSREALRILNDRNGRYDSFEVIRGSLDTAYMSIIGENNEKEREG